MHTHRNALIFKNNHLFLIFNFSWLDPYTCKHTLASWIWSFNGMFKCVWYSFSKLPNHLKKMHLRM